MKEIKMRIGSIVALIIFTLISIAGTITVWVLPASVFNASSSDEEQAIQIFLGSVLTALSLLFIFVVIKSIIDQKRHTEAINKLRASLGDDALIFEGRFVDPESTRENIKTTALSVAIAYFFGMVFGIGVYSIRTNGTPFRYFILFEKGLAVIHPYTRNIFSYPIGYKENVTIFGRKGGQVTIRFPEDAYYYTINTKNTELSKNELIDRRKSSYQDETVTAITYPTPAEEVFDIKGTD